MSEMATRFDSYAPLLNQDVHLKLKMGDLLAPDLKESLYRIAMEPSKREGRGVVAEFARHVTYATPWSSLLTGFGVGFATGALTQWIMKRIEKQKHDQQPSSAAFSEVTGGFPEDINGMPANTDETSDDPVYDGSELNLERRRKRFGNI